MSELTYTGGSAFPEIITSSNSNKGVYYSDTHSIGGMTLRDYFAAKALMSMLSPVQDINKSTPELAARWAYQFADAMLEARK